MNDKRLELYNHGLNDVEIARKLEVSVNTIQLWRTRNGLKPNASVGRPRTYFDSPLHDYWNKRYAERAKGKREKQK